MASLTTFLATNLLLFISAVRAIEFFQAVDGKCSDLPTIEEYDFRKMATGEWYYNYASFGQKGDKCMTAHGVPRGLMNYGAVLFFSSEKNQYVDMPSDLTYNPDIPGRYNSSTGVGQVVAIDADDNHVIVQCMEVEGKTQMMAVLGSRSPKVGTKAKEVLKQGTESLKNVKLLPKMHIVPQTDCPPLKDVIYY